MWHKVSIIPIDDQRAIIENQKVYGMKRWTPILHGKKTQKRVKAKLSPFTRCSCQCLIDALSSIFFLGNKIYFLQYRNVGGQDGSD